MARRRTYNVKKGQSWLDIAGELGTTANILTNANPDVKQLAGGQVINAPAEALEPGVLVAPPPVSPYTPPEPEPPPGVPHFVLPPQEPAPPPGVPVQAPTPPAPPRPRGGGGGVPDYGTGGPLEPTPQPGYVPPTYVPPQPEYQYPLKYGGPTGPPAGEIWMPTAPLQHTPYDPNYWQDLGGGGWFYNDPKGGYTSIVDYLFEQGIDPLVIPKPDVQRLNLTDYDRSLLGYEVDEWGNWIRIDYSAGGIPPIGGGSQAGWYYGGGGGRGGGGGGGGGEPTPPRPYTRPTSTYTGRTVYPGYSGTGRYIDPINMGLINWRI